ncbi:hypothetical protein RclHR1_00010022 [Rhizophagus clarus]|uniref:F-box domain-containing protein n=1 Tax=Rhizophagus clarus TaxID=94130 RepID=A0A2Z6Q079_9GLOM|nr:hypothetical protein RclHR1_00010022 [Rhizophagus clarus]GES75186.1 hypothetical protein GLOIN_2v1866989 [Rhizophagus clarus]
MFKLNRDILYLIFKELQDDEKSFFPCLLVNKTWSEIIIPILWKNPWKYLKKGNEKLLSNVILSHLSEESRNKLILNDHYNFLKNLNQKPLFDYINYCKHLHLNEIKRIIHVITDKKNEIQIIGNEILKLFINENRVFTHLYIPYRFDYQIHLIPGANRCFSDLQFLRCHTIINDNILTGLTEICESIKELELFIGWSENNYGIIKLIENQKKLFDIRLTYYYSRANESFFKILEISLIKHSNNVQYFKLTKQPITDILSSFVNLKRLELHDGFHYMPWNCLMNISLPFLQVLKATGIPVKALTSLIENTNGHLNEINIEDAVYDDINNKIFIQAIYKNCPNLKYLKVLVKNNNILELEILLIKCQYLNGLFLLFDSQKISDSQKNSNDLFKILAKSSPTNLFKFKFWFNFNFKSDSLKLFFDNWKGRHPMLLQFPPNDYYDSYNLMEKYKAEGIIKRYDNETYYEDFEWIEKKG